MVDVAFFLFLLIPVPQCHLCKQLQHTAALRVYDDAWLHFSGSALTVLYFIGGTLPDIRSGLIGIDHISLFHPHLIPYQYHFSNANGSARLENDTCQAILNLYHHDFSEEVQLFSAKSQASDQHQHPMRSRGSLTAICKSWAAAHLVPSSRRNAGSLMSGAPSRNLDPASCNGLDMMINQRIF